MKAKRRVTGLGGVFFKAKHPRKLCAWYKKHLGLPIDEAWCGWSFHWRDTDEPENRGTTVWSAFEHDTRYFGRGRQSWMLNYRVSNLRKVLAALKKEGVWVDPKVEVSDFGKFGWIKDCEGHRIELWEPPKEH